MRGGGGVGACSGLVVVIVAVVVVSALSHDESEKRVEGRLRGESS